MSDLIFPITEDSQVGEVRRIATVVAEELGFNDTQCGKVAIVVTEVAKNLVKHASEGQLLLRSIESKNIPGMEILGLDKGLGMEDIQKCLQDGFSTAGTPGNGLGAISRLSSFFDIYSVPKLGTVLLSRLWSKDLPLAKLNSSLEVGAICVPIAGEQVCGDAWSIYESPTKSSILVADGLGHGLGAAEASSKAVEIFQNSAHLSPKDIIEACHGALRGTRGTAIAIAEINFDQQTVRFAGVGNISASIITPLESRSMVS
ncbi:MAG TPA: ATP-binding SpoIIE family protein phosphatase, partial [Candidatus Sericytochromatia bacterium]